MPSPLAGKVVWLTAASSGIGEALARELAGAGCRLALSARSRDALLQLAATLSTGGRTVLAAAVDVSEREQVREAGSRIAGELGPVDVLIANAGTHIPTRAARFDADEYARLMNINFVGVLNCIQAVLPSMIERRSGHLVGVSSLAGYRGLPKAAAYGASKAALTHFLESLRFDLLEHNIAVTVVSPGFVRTPLTDKNDFPMPFLMEADDAAGVMLKGIAEQRFEVHFPKRFSYIMKLLRILPYPLYHRLIARKVLAG